MTVEIIISQEQPNVTPITDNGYVESVEITCYSQLLEIVDNSTNIPWIQSNIQFLNTIKGDKGDPGSGSTVQIDFTLSDWVSIAGGYELSLQHNLDNIVISQIYSGGKEVEADKIDFNENTIKLSVPYDFRFEGYAIIKN